MRAMPISPGLATSVTALACLAATSRDLGRERWTSRIVVGLSYVALEQVESIPSFKDVDWIEVRVGGCVTCHGQDGQGSSRMAHHPTSEESPAPGRRRSP